MCTISVNGLLPIRYAPIKKAKNKNQSLPLDPNPNQRVPWNSVYLTQLLTMRINSSAIH